MPPFALESLTASQVTDVVSYMLKVYEARAGNVALSVAINDGAPVSQEKAGWTTYGADLASTRYSKLDQINEENFGKLQTAWWLNTNNFGPTEVYAVPYSCLGGSCDLAR